VRRRRTQDVIETQHVVVHGAVARPHTRGVQRSRRDPATRAALDAANATFVAVIYFGLLTGVSTQLQSVRPQAPWEVDPYDAVASFAMMIVPIVALLTWIRKARWRREATFPSFVLVEIGRGSTVVLSAIAATDVAYLVAVLRRGFPAYAPWRPELLGLLGLSVATLVAASVVSAIAWSSQRPSIGERKDFALEGRPDAVDDVADLLRDGPAGLGPVRRGCLRAADLVGAWAESSVASPRRHPWVFVAVVSSAAGVALAASEFVHEGLPPNVGVGILVVAVFGAIVGVAGVLGYALLGRYLHLVRPPGHA